MVRHFPQNVSGRDFVVGDMHGCFDLFMAFVEGLELDPKVDRVFSVGDLINRGPDSAKCLALTQQSWFHSVRGNHEQMLLDVVKGGRHHALWIQNGGRWALDTKPGELTDYANWIGALPLAITVGEGERRFNVIHAEFFGSDEDLDARKIDQMAIQWGRDLIGGNWDGKSQDGLSVTYCGHSCVQQPKRAMQQVFIDTGAGHLNGVLSIVEPATGAHWVSKP